MKIIDLIKETWLDVLADTVVFVFLYNSFDLTRWQVFSLTLAFARIQYRVIDYLIGIRSHVNAMFKPVVISELELKRIREEIQDLKCHITKEDKVNV